MTKAESTTDRHMEFMPLENIKITKSNPRKVFDEEALDRLTENVKQHGVLTPILVRAIGENGSRRYELIAGERRLRAAKACGLKTIPAHVREMSDQEALEFMMIENLQRDNLHPMEEAEGFGRLHDQFQFSFDTLAERIGKSRSYVVQRMKLLDLVPTGRQAFWKDQLNITTAFLVARIPENLQEDALKKILRPVGQEPLSLGDVQRMLLREFTLNLSQAPFDIKDETLVKGAVACAACPKRTGNQSELFSDVSHKDTCTDPVCFKAKSDATWDRLKEAQATAANNLTGDAVQTLSDKEMKGIFPYGGGNSSPRGNWVGLDDECYEVTRASGKSKTWRRYLKDHMPPIFAGRIDGTIKYLVHQSDAMKALVDAKLIKKTSSSFSSPDQEKWKKDQARARKKAEMDNKIFAAQIGAIVDRAEHLGTPMKKGFWPIVAKALLESTWADTLKSISKRRGLKKKGSYGADELSEAFRKMNENQAYGLAIELYVTRHSDALKPMADWFVIKLDPIEAAVRKDAETKVTKKEKK